MKIPFSIGKKEFLLEPYTTAIEKEILLASSFEITKLDLILDILGMDASGLTENEMKVLLYKYREISNGDEIDMKFKCTKCGQGNDGVIQANSFITEPLRDDKDIKKLNYDCDDNNINEFLVNDIDIDNLDIQEYEDLIKRINDNQVKFDFSKKVTCLKCGHLNTFDIGDNSYIIEIMSDENLMSLYKTYNFLIFFGKYSKEGIDSMYPFERSIFMGLLNKTKEELNQ